jgi:alcohol dehydrogenase (cytochrome c)
MSPDKQFAQLVLLSLAAVGASLIFKLAVAETTLPATTSTLLAAQSTSESRHAERQADWPSCNRTLTSDRFAPQVQIDATNVQSLRPLCTYDTGIETSFQTGPATLRGMLYGTTEMDTFAVDALTCKQLWRVHEQVQPSTLKVNRGVAFADGRMVRGLQDGRVVAYRARDSKRLWERRIADAAKYGSVPAAPNAWNRLVFVGNAGGDNYDVQGRMDALDAASGESKFVPFPLITWGNEPDVPISGGATWIWYTLDPKSGLLYATDAERWNRKFAGALGGGIISYAVDGQQLPAVAHGMRSPVWPAPQSTAKVTVFGL